MPIVTPMINVPDVKAAVLWYERIGFTLLSCHGEAHGFSERLPEEAGLDWACLRLGDSEIMLNAGGRAADAERRDVSLYVHLQPGDGDVDTLHARLKERVEIGEPPYDAFHGHREFSVRDLNGFWVVFAEPLRRR